MDRNELDLSERLNDDFIRIGFQIDPNEDTYQRRVYTFLDMTGQIGGVFEILSVLVGAIVRFVGFKIFILSIMSRLYFVKEYNQVQRNDKFTISKSKRISPINDNKTMNKSNDSVYISSVYSNK